MMMPPDRHRQPKIWQARLRTAAKFFAFIGLLLGLLGSLQLVAHSLEKDGVFDGPWDNNLFKARSGYWPEENDPKSSGRQSGVDGQLYDPKDSTGKSGVPESERPQKFFIPPTPDFKDVDLSELEDYEGTDYSPYALVLVHRPVGFAGQKLDRGYYLVMLGNRWDGSQVKTLAQVENPKDIYPNRMPQETPKKKKLKRADNDIPMMENIAEPKKLIPRYEAMIVKKLGKVVAVFPVTSVQPVPRLKRKQNGAWKQWLGRPVKPVGRVVMDGATPVLQIWKGSAIYSSKLALMP